MTRLVLLSDSHGRKTEFEEICKLHPEASRFIFLGDGAGEFEQLKAEHPDWPLIGVKGNCDLGSDLPRDLELIIDGKRLFCTHGNGYAVKSGTWMLADEAKARGCAAAFYGHTHTQDSVYDGGVLCVNPGAVSDYFSPKYAIVDITGNGTMVTSLCELKPGRR